MKTLIAFLLLSVPLQAQEIIPVFFAGGQSNAKPAWAQAIQEELRRIYHPQTVVVNHRHGGNGLWNWSDDGFPQPNYFEDTVILEDAMLAIVAEGNTPVFEGIFWFQGESDCYAGPVSRYRERFRDMAGWYRNEFNPDSAICIMVIDGILPWTNHTQENIDGLRAAQFDIGQPRPGFSLVDTRIYERYDQLHLTVDSQIDCGIAAARAFTFTFGPRKLTKSR